MVVRIPEARHQKTITSPEKSGFSGDFIKKEILS
jgi:hypothetical protein